MGGEPFSCGGSGISGPALERASAGGFDADDAVGAESVSVVGEDVCAEDSGDLSLGADRAAIYEAADLRVVCEPDLSGAWDVWVRGGVGVFLQQEGEGPDAAGGCSTGSVAEGAGGLLAAKVPGTRDEAAEPGDQRDAAGWEDHAGSGECSEGCSAGVAPGGSGELGCAVFCGGGAAAIGEAVWRGGGAWRRTAGVYDARSRSAAGGEESGDGRYGGV